MAKPLDIEAFGGINANHNRKLGQPSNGKNFITVDGALKTRPGTSEVTAPTGSGAIRTLHSGAIKDYARLLLEEGTNLHLRTGAAGAWSNIKSNLDSTKKLRSCRWQSHILLGNGAEQLSFNISDGTLSILKNTEGGGSNPKIGTTKTNIATGKFTYAISGTEYIKDAVAAGTAPGTDVIPQNKYGAVALDIGADGTLDLVKATNNTTGYDTSALALAGLPAVAADHVRACTLTVMKSDGAFTFGTTELDAANVTAAYATGSSVYALAPAAEGYASWKFRPWKWAPNYDNPHLLYYAGYDSTGLVISKDSWPANYNLNIGGSSANPVLNAIPYGSHLLCLTKESFKRVYGDSEDSYEVIEGGEVGVYGEDMSGKVATIVMWVGTDKKVYYYSGTQPVPISDPIDTLLASENFANATVHIIDTEFRLVFANSPSSGKSRAYIYETTEAAWYLHEYPFVINASVPFNVYLQPKDWLLGTSSGKIAKIDSSVTTDLGTSITTEFTLGPFRLESRDLRLKRLYLTSDPDNYFNLGVYASRDQGTEKFITSSKYAFKKGNPATKDASLKAMRGQNLSIRVTTTDKIDRLLGGTITLEPQGVR